MPRLGRVMLNCFSNLVFFFTIFFTMERSNFKLDMQHANKSFPCSKRSFYVNHFYLITSFVYIFPVVMFIFYLFILVFKNSRFKHDWQFITLKINIIFLFVFKVNSGKQLKEIIWKLSEDTSYKTAFTSENFIEIGSEMTSGQFVFLIAAFTRQ